MRIDMLSFRQLKHFVVLAETLHYRKAAERLFITQPSLSRQIVSIENEVGFRLFERQTRAVILTPAGKVFLQRAKELISAADKAVNASLAIALGEQGTLRIAFSSFFSSTLLPPLILKYCEGFPNVELILNELSPLDLITTVEKGESDLSFLLKAEPSVHTGYKPLHMEKICAVLPERHLLAQVRKFTPHMLKDEPFIVSPREITPALFDVVHLCCKQHGFEPKIRMRLHLQQTIVSFVAAGIGVALVPESMKHSGIRGVVFRDIEDAPVIEFGVLWRKDNGNPCLNSMLSLMTDKY